MLSLLLKKHLLQLFASPGSFLVHVREEWVLAHFSSEIKLHVGPRVLGGGVGQGGVERMGSN